MEEPTATEPKKYEYYRSTFYFKGKQYSATSSKSPRDADRKADAKKRAMERGETATGGDMAAISCLPDRRITMPDEKAPDKKYEYLTATFTAGTRPDGKPNRIYVRGKTKPELKDKLAEAKRLYGLGIDLADTTVRDWSERWMRVYMANKSETQRAHYQTKLDKDILPAIGSMKIKDVRRSHLLELLNAYAGGKKGTVVKIRIAVERLFKDAAAEGLIERNPAIELELPELTEKPRRPLTDIERAVVLEVAKTHPQGAYVLTLLYCGLRRGEATALTVGDIDFKRRMISVNKSLNLRGNARIIKSPKSDAGTREVPIPDAIFDVLRAICSGKTPEALLFPRPNGTCATQQGCERWWKSFKRQCHITAGATLYRNAVKVETSPFDDVISPHYLRHTFATDLYSAGVDEKARKYILGHSTNDVTDIYTKMTDTALKRAAAKINAYNKKALEAAEGISLPVEQEIHQKVG
jgi:integrase